MPIHLYWGEEDFNLKNAVNLLRDKIVDKNFASLGHKILHEPDVETIIESIQTLPMMFGDLLVEVNSSNLFLRGKKKLASADPLMKKFLTVLEQVNPKVHLLFVCPIPRDSGKKIDSTLKLTKLIKQIGNVQEFPAYKFYEEDKILSWIFQQAKLKEIKINKDAALLLLQNTGSELRKLDTELEKIKTSVYPKDIILKKDVEAMSSSHENIFLLADYWLKGNKVGALQELHKLFERNHALRIIATLQTMSRRWLRIKMESTRCNSFEISKKVNLPKFVVEQDMRKLKNIPEEKLVELREKIAGIEYQIKAGVLSAELAMEILIAS